MFYWKGDSGMGYTKEDREADANWFREMYKQGAFTKYFEDAKKNLLPSGNQCFIIVKNKKVLDVYVGMNGIDASQYAEHFYPDKEWALCTDYMMPYEDWVNLRAQNLKGVPTKEILMRQKNNSTSFITEGNKITLDYDGEFRTLRSFLEMYINGIKKDIFVAFDTGSTSTTINSELLSNYTLNTDDDMLVDLIQGKALFHNTRIEIEIAGARFENIKVLLVDQLDKRKNVDMIIGMDIISHGKLFVDGTGEKKHFELEFPENAVFDMTYWE